MPNSNPVSRCQHLRDVRALDLHNPTFGVIRWVEYALRRCLCAGLLSILCAARRIENLDRLLNLRELNLSENAIGKIENLRHLKQLRTLNLAENRIEQVSPPFGVGI